MRSPTSWEDSWLVRIVVPCAQTRLPRPRAIEMHSRVRASGASAARFDRPARQATEPRAKREAMSVLCHGLVVDSTFEPGVRTSVSLISYSWPPVRGVVFICACAILTGTRLYYSMLLVVFSHINPWLWHQTYLLLSNILLCLRNCNILHSIVYCACAI